MRFVNIPHLAQLLEGQRVSRPDGAHDVELRQLGLLFDATSMWLADDAQPIDSSRVIAGLSARAAATWSNLAVVNECASTNATLVAHIASGAPAKGSALTTEYQWGGRGRRGRSWLSPVARNIALSVVWEHSGSLADMPGLSLAVGVACADALHTLGLTQVALKWPNDLIVPMVDQGYAKLGGILVELQSLPDRSTAVIGIGLNFAGARLLRPQVEQPLADIAELQEGLDRSTLVSALLNALADYLDQFSQSGFAPLLSVWDELHAFTGKHVVVGDPENLEKGEFGVVLGGAESGELRLATPDGERLVGAGEVSLRPRSAFHKDQGSQNQGSPKQGAGDEFS